MNPSEWNQAQVRYPQQLGSVTIGNAYGKGISNGIDPVELQRMFASSSQQQKEQKLNGNKPIVVCGGKTIEAKDLDEAQAIAEREAHAQGTDAYILKPVRMVAPKRDVVTTDL